MYPIPANATRIRYLESTGTQYVDTGFNHNQDTRFVCHFYCVTAAAWGYFFGAFGGASNSGKNTSLELDGSLHLRAYYGDARSSDYGLVGLGEHWVDFNKNAIRIDAREFTLSSHTFSSDYNDFVFCASNRSGNATGFSKIRLFSFRIYDNDVLVRSFVPVRVGQVGYLFDRVSGQLFGNAGTGDFVLGPDTFSQGVVPTRMMAMGVRKKLPYDAEVEYLEAVGPSGTQAVNLGAPGIDTGIVPSTKARIEIDWMPIRTGTISAAEPMAGGVAGFVPTGESSDNSRFACGLSSSGPSLYWGISKNNIYGSVSWSSGTRVRQFIQMDDTTATYGYGTTSFTKTINSYNNTYKTIALFGRNSNNTNVFALQTQPQQTTRIYSCKIWQDHTSSLSRDFIPVRKGTTGYLYDKVSKQLLGNVSTGTFVIGPDK